MKGGQTPIHLWGRWSPTDYLEDEVVKLVGLRGDTASDAVYFRVLQASHRAGGDLPADREELAAMIGLPLRVVKKGLAIWIERGKLIEKDGRIYNPRCLSEVQAELEFRAEQAVLGRKGGLARAVRQAQGKPKASPRQAYEGPQGIGKADSSPPAPAPAPAPDACRAPANPLLAGKRPELERECLALVRRMSELTGEDAIDVIARASGFEGAKRTAINPATMSDDRLANTVRDLRADVAEEERKAKLKAASGPRAVVSRGA